MLLAVDVGNSQTVIGVFDGDELVEHWRLSTHSRRTSDEWALLFGGLMQFANLSFSRNVHGVVLASVVPMVTETLRDMTRRYFRFPPVVVEPGTATGVAIKTENPREVGSERLVNALAAYDEHGGPGIVVDFGTATNFDVYDDGGAFVGGAIAPGVQTSMEALTARGAQLGAVEMAVPAHAIGLNTVENMQSGAVYGFAGQVERIVAEISAELPSRPVVIATGGLAGVVAESCACIDHYDPWLTLKGLRIVWERNT